MERRPREDLELDHVENNIGNFLKKVFIAVCLAIIVLIIVLDDIDPLMWVLFSLMLILGYLVCVRY